MKPIIGILLREETTKEENKVMVLYENIYKAIKSLGGIVLGIDCYDERILNLCDGIIAQGGDMIREEDEQIIKYAYDKDIPFLGICLGMQEMSYFFNGKLNDFEDTFHKQKKDYVHSVKIEKDSHLYEIFQKDSILVNSRHRSYVEKTDLQKSAFFENVIEAVEDKNKTFFLGVQWHPESMIPYDEDARKLMNEFMKVCSK